jgi:hypothetical protein
VAHSTPPAGATAKLEIPPELQDLLARCAAAKNGALPDLREAIRACLNAAGLLNADGDLDLERDPSRRGIAPHPTLLTAQAALDGEPAILAAPGRELLAHLHHRGGSIPALLDDPAELAHLARTYIHDRTSYDAGLLRLKGLFPGDELDSLRRAVTARAKELRPPRTRTSLADLQPRREFRNDDGDPEDPRVYVRRKLGLPIQRLVRRPADSGNLYDFELDDGRQVPVGASVLDPRTVEKVLEGRDVVIPYYPPAKWRKVAEALILIVENEQGVTATDITKAWIAGATDGRLGRPLNLADDADRAEAIEHGATNGGFWATDGVLYVYLDELEQHVRVHLKMPITRAQLVARLSRLGFTRERLREKKHDRGQVIARRVFWRSPAGFQLDDDADDEE